VLYLLGRLGLAAEEAFLKRLLRIVEQFGSFAVNKTASRAQPRFNVEVAGDILRHALWKRKRHAIANRVSDRLYTGDRSFAISRSEDTAFSRDGHGLFRLAAGASEREATGEASPV
jgi:hypothetical protein